MIDSVPSSAPVHAAGHRGVDHADPAVGLASQPLAEAPDPGRRRRRGDDEEQVVGLGGQQSVLAGQHVLDLGEVGAA